MSRPRPRLVHVTTTDISLALLLGMQLRAFAAAGYEVLGVSAPGPYVERLEEWGIEHVPLLHATRSMAPWQDVRALSELRGALGRLRPEIVHTHNPKPGIYGRVAARSRRTPVIVNTVHGLYASPDDGLPRRAAVYTLERLAAMCSHAELVQNPEDLETLAKIGVPRDRLHLLGNGVDLARFDPARWSGRRDAMRAEIGIGPDEVLVGVVGRMVAEKGYREVFAAAERLREQRSRARVVVVGPADPAKADALDRDDLDRAAAGGVVFLGARDDVEDLYAAMDLYVLASYREGFPRSAMEAAAMGLPVVATDIRGCRQVVEPGRTGLLVPVRDAPALAAAVGALVDDPAQRAAMGAAGRVKALAEFDEQRVVDTTLGVYEQLLRAREPRS